MDLRRRCDIAEMIDTETLPVEEYARCLADLAQINRMTMTHRPTLAWLDRATAGWRRGAALTVLDVGCGQGDLLRSIERWAARKGFVARLTGIDVNPLGARVARQAGPAESVVTFRTADVFDYRPDPRPDFIVSSQFTHHLSDAKVAEFLRWLDRHAVHGWFNVDMERHLVPYVAFKVVAALTRWHQVIKRDGAVSIARSLRPAEWAARMADAGVQGDISRYLSYRISVAHLR